MMVRPRGGSFFTSASEVLAYSTVEVQATSAGIRGTFRLSAAASSRRPSLEVAGAGAFCHPERLHDVVLVEDAEAQPGHARDGGRQRWGDGEEDPVRPAGARQPDALHRCAVDLEVDAAHGDLDAHAARFLLAPEELLLHQGHVAGRLDDGVERADLDAQLHDLAGRKHGVLRDVHDERSPASRKNAEFTYRVSGSGFAAGAASRLSPRDAVTAADERSRRSPLGRTGAFTLLLIGGRSLFFGLVRARLNALSMATLAGLSPPPSLTWNSIVSHAFRTESDAVSNSSRTLPPERFSFLARGSAISVTTSRRASSSGIFE